MSSKLRSLRTATPTALQTHILSGSHPHMRIGGELKTIADAPRLSQDDTLDMAFS